MTPLYVVVLFLVTFHGTHSGLTEFYKMVKEYVGRNPRDYLGYGNWCGKGGSGNTIDKLDESSNMASYGFPILKHEDILVFINEIYPALKFTENDLKCLQPSRLSAVYQFILEIMFDFKEELYQLPLCDADVLPYRELYEESLPLVTFSLVMNYVMSQIGLPDFSLSDILEPKPKRTVKILSCLINFYRFFFSRIDVYEGIKTEKIVVKAESVKLKKSNELLQNQISTLKAAQAEQELEAKQIQNLLETVKQRMTEHHKEQAAKLTKINELKVKLKEKENSLEQKRMLIAKEKEKDERLSRQIVQSPERMKSELEKLKTEVVTAKETKKKALERLNELKEHTTQRKSDDYELDHLVSLLNNIKEENDKMKELNQQISTQTYQIQTQQDKLHDNNAKLEQLLKTVTSRKEKLSKMDFQHRMRMNAKKENIVALKKERELLHQAHNEDEIVKSSLDMEKQHQLQIIEAKKDKCEKDITTLKNMYSQISEQIDAYHMNLSDGWEQVEKKMEDK